MPESSEHARLLELFAVASDLEGDARTAYLDDTCGVESPLRTQLDAMLGIDDDTRVALDEPAVGRLDAAAAAALASARVEAEAPPPDHVGPYTIVGVLGQGGMGTVYEAEQDNPRRRVALKVIRSDCVTAELLQRFERETLILGWLNHPGIAQIYEAGTASVGERTVPYMAMELVRGTPITEYARAKKLDASARLELLVRVGEAAHYAHQQGVVHRDIKPANVLVDGEGQPKILDFGVARSTDPDAHLATLQTSAGAVVGTLAYMSPEQVMGSSAQIDARADVYGLGALAYELLGGQRVFDLRDKPIHEAATIILRTEPTSLGQVVKGLRGDIETIVTKALEKEPDRRYATAADLVEDIRRHLRSEPIRARPPTTLYQLRKYARRNRAVVVGLTGIALALGVGLVVSLTQYFKAEARRVELDDALADSREAVKEAESATVFLSDTLAKASPDESTGDLTVRTLLERAAPDVDAAFKDSPRVASRLHQTISRAFEGLGVMAPYAHHAGRAHETHIAAYGPHDPRTLRAQAVRGEALTRIGKVEEAESLLASGLSAAKQHLGDAHGVTTALRIASGKHWKTRGEFAKAREHLDAALAATETQPDGELKEATRTSILAVLGIVLARVGELDAAERAFTSVLALRTKVKGPAHPLTMEAQYNLATVYSMQGRTEDVLAIDQKILAMRRERLGEDHLSTFTSMHAVGQSLAALGRTEEALPYLEGAATGLAKHRGPEHLNTMVTLGELANAKQALGHTEEARTIYEALATTSAKALGPNHWLTLGVRDAQASILRDEGRHAEALKIHEDIIARAGASMGTRAQVTTTARAGAVLALIGVERYQDALERGRMLVQDMEQAGVLGTSVGYELLVALARLRWTEGSTYDPAAGLSWAERATDHARADARAWVERAELLVVLKRLEKAVAVLEEGAKAIKSDDVHRDALEARLTKLRTALAAR